MMELFAELLKSPIGLMSLLTIGFVMVIATVLFFWVKKQVEKDAEKQNH